MPINGLKETGFLTNETVFSLTELPKGNVDDQIIAMLAKAEASDV